MSKVRWGVIGAVGIADRRTIPEGIMAAANSELAAVMSIPGTGVEKIAEKYGGVPWFTEVEAMLDGVELDACYLATPPHVHLAEVEACAARGHHILCEKPLDVTVAGAERIAEVCREAGVKLGIGFMMPFHHLAVEAKRLVAEGVLGKIVSARAQFGFDYPPLPGAFRQSKELHRGGAFMDVGNHGAGLLEFILGMRVDSVVAMTENVVHQYEGVEDAAIAVLHFDSGALGIVDTFFSASAAQNLLEINGAQRTLIAEGVLGQGAGGTLRVLEGGGEYLRIESEGRNMYEQEISAFAQAILDDTEPPMSAEEGVWSQKIVEAVYQAAERGQRVKVAEM